MPKLFLVKRCKSTNGHLFPKDEKICDLWMKALNIKSFKSKTKNFVCHVHFKQEDFVKEGFFSGKLVILTIIFI